MAMNQICPRGHRWQSVGAEGSTPTGSDGETACPVCGGASLADGTAVTEAPARTPAAPPAPAELPPRRGEADVADRPVLPGYEFLGVLGKGGMGVVYKARQTSLNRVVAVKMLAAGGRAGPALVSRFRTEAEAVARVQHPNIVQIFEVGQADGRPYCTLEYAGGGSLDDRLAGTPMPSADAARLVATLARAVHHAHERGILHRDLKPANVLLAEDGTPKVSDFGLAKLVQDSSGLTEPGAVMGTPSYMAPEQAQGDTARMGPSADVYALGAILYECLTGRPPFRAGTALGTLRQVVGDEPVPPRRLEPAVPRDLETICLHCLQKAPDRRYPSAGELAEDLNRFLAGEPILARPVGPARRLLKWGRRHPAAAALLAVSALALLTILAGNTWYSVRLHDALTQKELEQERAVRHLGLAQDAIAEFTRIGDEGLAPLPHTEHVRAQLLQSQLSLCETLLRQEGDDPATRHTVARAALQACVLQRLLHRLPQAEQSSDRALALLGRLAEEAPGRPEYRRDLAAAWVTRGLLLTAAGRQPQEVAAAYGRAEPLFEKLIEEFPSVPEYRRDLGKVYNNQAVLLVRQGRLPEARQKHERALEVRRRLAEEAPDVASYRWDLAVTHNNLGKVRLSGGETDPARQAFTEARDTLLGVESQLRQRPDFRRDLAFTHNNLAGTLQQLGRVGEAEKSFRDGLALLEELRSQFSAVPLYAEATAGVHFNLGLLLREDAGRAPECEKAFQEAARLYERLGDDHREVPRHRDDLAMSLYHLGRVLRGAGRPSEAGVVLRRAETLGRDLAERAPANAEYKKHLELVEKALAELRQ